MEEPVQKRMRGEPSSVSEPCEPKMPVTNVLRLFWAQQGAAGASRAAGRDRSFPTILAAVSLT